MSAAILIGVHCRFCPRIIPNSIARHYGSEANGYICPDCLVKEQNDLALFGQQLSAEADLDTIHVTLPGSPWGCQMCGTTTPKTYREVKIDNAIGYICLACEPKWAALNREKVGPMEQFARKLK